MSVLSSLLWEFWWAVNEVWHQHHEWHQHGAGHVQVAALAACDLMEHLFTFLPDFFFPDNVWPTRYMAETKFWIVPLNVCFIFFTKYFALFLTSSLLMLSLTTCFIWSVTWIISLRTSVFSLSSLSSSLKSCQEFSEISLSGWSVEVDGIFWSKIFSCCCCWCCCDVLV